MRRTVQFGHLPTIPILTVWLAAALGQLGRIDEAGQALENWREMDSNPRFRSVAEGPMVRRLSAGGGWIRTSGTADDARLLADPEPLCHAS